MSPSAAAAGSNDTVVNYIAQKLVFSGKIKIRLIQYLKYSSEDILFLRNAALNTIYI